MSRDRVHPRGRGALALRFGVFLIDRQPGGPDLALMIGAPRFDLVELGAGFVGQLGLAAEPDRPLAILRLLVE